MNELIHSEIVKCTKLLQLKILLNKDTSFGFEFELLECEIAEIWKITDWLILESAIQSVLYLPMC